MMQQHQNNDDDADEEEEEDFESAIMGAIEELGSFLAEKITLIESTQSAMLHTLQEVLQRLDKMSKA